MQGGRYKKIIYNLYREIKIMCVQNITHHHVGNGLAARGGGDL